MDRESLWGRTGKRFRAVLPALLLCHVPCSVLAQGGAPAGTVAFQQSVGPDGAARISIPIPVPPGVGGLQPNLSLAYASSAPNGLAGYGWDISGLGAITRCPATEPIDGSRGRIGFDANDRFCLDGKRLVLASGASYGAAGSTYRTLVDEFSRITANGNAGSGPASFTVQTKAGLTLEYGSTADSAVNVQGRSTVMIWALSRVSDARSNYMEVSYTKDADDASIRPDRIRYTGNTTRGTAPGNSVQFAYEPRPDQRFGYVAGSAMATRMRLAAISTFSGTNPADTYTLTFASAAGTTKSSYPLSITRCSSTDGCLAPLQLDWAPKVADTGAMQAPYAYPGWNFGTNRDAAFSTVGDFNGDGKSDFAWVQPTAITRFISRGDGTFDPATHVFPDVDYGTNRSLWSFLAGDFNADGLPDVAWVSPTEIRTYLNQGGSGFSPAMSYSYPNGWNFGLDRAASFARTGDFDGDGRTDLLWVQRTNMVVFRSGGDGSFAATVYPYPNGWDIGTNRDQVSIEVADFDGDGRTDVAWVQPTQVVNFSSNGAGQFTHSVYQYPASMNFGTDRRVWQLATGDFNGDGVEDIIRFGLSSAILFIGKADGTYVPLGFEYPNGWNFGLDRNAWFTQTGDFNGDGRLDFAWVSGREFLAFLSVGDGNFVTRRFDFPQGLNFGVDRSIWQLTAGDFDGDGHSDCLWIAPTLAYAFQSVNDSEGLLRRVASTTGPEGLFDYVPLTGSSYTKDQGANYPVIDARPPLFVVRTLGRSDGVGGHASTDYSYGGLKAEAGTGRGMLGFRWTAARDRSTGITSYAENRQDWPFTGVPLKQERRLPGSGNGGVLERVTTTWAWQPGSVPGSVFIHPALSVQEAWDLGGQAHPSVTTASRYLQSPQYGDPTEIAVSTSDGASKVTANEYWPATTSGTSWILGRLKRATVSSSKP